MTPSRRPPDVDVAGLALLRAIGELGSLGAAAGRLQLAQPNASRLLARLEADLRLRLVDRSPRGSRLTPEGQLVAEWAEPVLTGLDRVVNGAASLRQDVDSHLSVGASLTVGEHLAPRWLAAFRALHPHVQVRLQVMNSADVIEAVEGGHLDLGFIESPDLPRGLHATLVERDELVLVVAPNHPWARRRRPITLDELAATPLVVREPGSGTRRTVDALLAGRETAPPVMELSSTGAIVQCVAAGTGPAVVSTLAIEPVVRDGLVVVVPLDGVVLGRNLRAIWRSPRRLDGPAGDFVVHVKRTRDAARRAQTSSPQPPRVKRSTTS